MGKRKADYHKRKKPNPKPKLNKPDRRCSTGKKKENTTSHLELRSKSCDPILQATSDRILPERAENDLSSESQTASPAIKFVDWPKEAENIYTSLVNCADSSPTFRPEVATKVYRRKVNNECSGSVKSRRKIFETPQKSANDQGTTNNEQEAEEPAPTPTSIRKQREYEKEVEAHKLQIVYERPPGKDKNIETLKHRRIVDIGHIITESRKLESHKCHIDPKAGLEFLEEEVQGLMSYLIFKCDGCGLSRRISTAQNANPTKINKAAVAAMYASGKGHYHLDEILTFLDVPTMSYDTFSKMEADVGQSWLDCVTEEIIANGKAERAIPISKQFFADDGTPEISVLADASWSHRSYGKKYNAKSGALVVIGKYTKKPLYVGVRNKYCCICEAARKSKKAPKEHACFKNWSGSSTGMEADMVVQAFKDSEESHGVRYKILIADGDSTAYSRIIEEVSYGREVIKINCTNHIMKNVSNRLYKLHGSLSMKDSPQEKKWLSKQKIRSIVKVYTKGFGEDFRNGS